MNDFEEFEKDLDDEIKSLTILDKPLRSIMTMLYLNIDICYTENQALGEDLISRLSYLLAIILKSDSSVIGANARNALSIFTDEDLESGFIPFFNYAHFCELSPFIWRKIFLYEIDKEGILNLKYKEGYGDIESRDIILSYLSLPAAIIPPRGVANQYENIIKTYLLNGKVCLNHMLFEVKKYSDWYKEYSFHNNLFSNEIYKESLDVTEDEFNRFQSLWFGIAEYHIQMSIAIKEYLKINYSKSLEDELLEFIAPLLKVNFIKGLFNTMATLSIPKFDRLMSVFTINNKGNGNFGEGYTPPFIKIMESYLFSPYIVLKMITPRNILYGILKNNQKKFDNKISHLFEPNLINVVINIFKGIENIEIQINKTWEKSEFDILVYFPISNYLLHIQAKAAIPSEGARMVSRLETRIEEGINQIELFRNLKILRKRILFLKYLIRKLKIFQLSI